MSQHNCRYCSHPLHKPSSISLCSAHWPKLDPYPYFASPKPEAHFLEVHQNMPANSKLGIKLLETKATFVLIVSKLFLSFFFTLYHFKGCWPWAASEPRVQSTDVASLGDTKFIASPFNPTCPRKSLWEIFWHYRKQYWKQSADSCAYFLTWYDHFCHVKSLFPWSSPWSTTAPRTPVSHVS